MTNGITNSCRIDREAFIRLLEKQIPEIHAELDTDNLDSIHAVMGDVSRATADAIENEKWNEVLSHYAFMEFILSNADPSVENAIYVSYLENILLGETDAKHLHAKSLLPIRLQSAFDELVAHFEMLAASYKRRSETD